MPKPTSLQQFNQQMLDEHLEHLINSPAYFAVWNFGREFERKRVRNKTMKAKE